MAHDLQYFADRLEINDLLYRYTNAIDTKDFDQLREVFVPDAHIDYSASGGTSGAFPEVVKWLAQTLAMFSMTQHFVTNSQVTIDGDQASGRTYFYNPMKFADGKSLVVGGYYNDRFVRTPHGWRIAERIEEMAFMDGPV
jgi:3-phenylpropionate/cinnamic acid dioxygenase small subunit